MFQGDLPTKGGLLGFVLNINTEIIVIEILQQLANHQYPQYILFIILYLFVPAGSELEPEMSMRESTVTFQNFLSTVIDIIYAETL